MIVIAKNEVMKQFTKLTDCFSRQVGIAMTITERKRYERKQIIRIDQPLL